MNSMLNFCIGKLLLIFKLFVEYNKLSPLLENIIRSYLPWCCIYMYLLDVEKALIRQLIYNLVCFNDYSSA